MGRSRAFTLVELLVVVALVAVLAALIFPAFRSAKIATSRAISANSLQQLIAAGKGYLAEHENVFWRYREDIPGQGTMFWFGWETEESVRGTAEGERSVDLSKGPLGPYVIATGGVKTDPAFLAFKDRLKPKYKDGNYGYGYNTVLGNFPPKYDPPEPPRNALHVQRPAEVVVFATSAQVNTFQKPASAKNPLLEEFYMINENEVTVHFRHGGKALAAFLDGSVREVPMDPTTLNRKMPEANVGRFAPPKSFKYLWN